jgi:hypothetical protein
MRAPPASRCCSQIQQFFSNLDEGSSKKADRSEKGPNSLFWSITAPKVATTPPGYKNRSASCPVGPPRTIEMPQFSILGHAQRSACATLSEFHAVRYPPCTEVGAERVGRGSEQCLRNRSSGSKRGSSDAKTSMMSEPQAPNRNVGGNKLLLRWNTFLT